MAELHTRNRSIMNQGWTWHRIHAIKPVSNQAYFWKASIKRRIKTKNYNCNDMEQTKCLDDFYMKEMNCSFPWLKSTNASLLRTCGQKHYIQGSQ